MNDTCFSSRIESKSFRLTTTFRSFEFTYPNKIPFICSLTDGFAVVLKDDDDDDASEVPISDCRKVRSADDMIGFGVKSRSSREETSYGRQLARRGRMRRWMLDGMKRWMGWR